MKRRGSLDPLTEEALNKKISSRLNRQKKKVDAKVQCLESIITHDAHPVVRSVVESKIISLVGSGTRGSPHVNSPLASNAFSEKAVRTPPDMQKRMDLFRERINLHRVPSNDVISPTLIPTQDFLMNTVRKPSKAPPPSMHPIIAMLMEDEVADDNEENNSNENVEPRPKRRKTISGSSDSSDLTNEMHQLPPNFAPSVLKESKNSNLNYISETLNANSASLIERNMRSKNLFGAKISEENDANKMPIKDGKNNENLFVSETNEFAILDDHCPETVSSGSQVTFAPSVPAVPDSLEFVRNLKNFAESSQAVSNNSSSSQEVKNQAISQNSQLYDSQSQNIHTDKSSKKMATRNKKKRIAKPHAIQSQNIFTPSKVQDFDIFEDNRRILPKEARMMIKTTPKVARISTLDRSELHSQVTLQPVKSKLLSEPMESYPTVQVVNPIVTDLPVVMVSSEDQIDLSAKKAQTVNLHRNIIKHLSNNVHVEATNSSTNVKLNTEQFTRSSRNQKLNGQKKTTPAYPNGAIDTESHFSQSCAGREISQSKTVEVTESIQVPESVNHESNNPGEQNQFNSSSCRENSATRIPDSYQDVTSTNADKQEEVRNDAVDDQMMDRLSSRRTRSRKTKNEAKSVERTVEKRGGKMCELIYRDQVGADYGTESTGAVMEAAIEHCQTLQTGNNRSGASNGNEQMNEQFYNADPAIGIRQPLEVEHQTPVEALTVANQVQQQISSDEEENATASGLAMTTRSCSRDADRANKPARINYEQSPDKKAKCNRKPVKRRTKKRPELNKTINIVPMEPQRTKVVSQPTMLTKMCSQTQSSEEETSLCNGELNEIEFGINIGDLRNGREICSKRNQEPPLFTVRASIDACSMEKKGSRRMKKKLSKIESNEQKTDSLTSNNSIRGGVCGHMVIHSTTLSPKQQKTLCRALKILKGNAGEIEHGNEKVSESKAASKRFRGSGVAKNLGVYEVANDAGRSLEGVTHLVCGDSSKRTLSVLFAIARGCWVMDFNWVTASLDAGNWIPEKEFEISSFPGAKINRERLSLMKLNALHQSKLQKVSLKTTSIVVKPPRILSCNCLLYVLEGTQPPRHELITLIALCGGWLVDNPEHAKYLIGHRDEQNLPVKVKSRVNLFSIPLVKETWILDSIATGHQQCIDDYLINLN